MTLDHRSRRHIFDGREDCDMDGRVRELGLVNSGRGGSGDSPSTGDRSGASWAVATACLTAVWAVGVGNGGGGSASAMVSPCGGR
eukprot:scaffold29820_cov95-Cyclotella_meneghiniana.AAC.5